MSAITSELARLSGPLAYLVVAALVFGETALFFGFVLPGEIAVVLGGVLASRGRVSLPLLIVVVVAAAIIGPLVGYEIGGGWGAGWSAPASCAGYRARWTRPRRR